jgi:hypothetical protein
VLNHYIQKNIVYQLALSDGLRFSELKPDDLDNKLFTYHLKIVIQLGLVTKSDEGLYSLTPKGKTLGIHVFSEARDIFSRARPELLLAISAGDQWLVYRRLNEPLRGLVGFIHTEPEAGISTAEKAAQFLFDTCHIEATFTPRGAGIISTYRNGQIESYINYTVLFAEVSAQPITASDPHAEYFWLVKNNVQSSTLLPNMPDILDGLRQNQFFFIDTSYQL